MQGKRNGKDVVEMCKGNVILTRMVALCQKAQQESHNWYVILLPRKHCYIIKYTR